MAAILDVANLEERWAICKVEDDRKSALIGVSLNKLMQSFGWMLIYLAQDLFNHVETLTRKLAEAEQSLEEKNIYIKSVKQSGAEMKLQINQLQSEKDKYSFSFVVIDGDCMPFTDELITQGFEGGKKAAGMLRQTILDQLPELDPDMPHHSQVMIRVYANLKGLAKVYHDTQILKNVETLNDFVRGFNRGSYLCDFVDAGNGKECADEKVKARSEAKSY
ncbi:hypothetical protein COL26b_010178 [Colletotrichum chrysophilum]|uniref:uncharacterized protein n=1 Tax=Colletotrichum chrysophilum TaxID=1836956 RepID=UPI00230193FD|nr:uncharacterized protein COL26b_010178 [Colletotrichum chrysophilum]KAJ0370075.1 hypothetical protein COL26b_010178 [Colletotrichum chrysophilum]